jgi:hypothetical protein
MLDGSRFYLPENIILYLLNLTVDEHARFYADEDPGKNMLDAAFQDIRNNKLPYKDGVFTACKPKS